MLAEKAIKCLRTNGFIKTGGKSHGFNRGMKPVSLDFLLLLLYNKKKS